jgi:hypothetical protein
MNVLRGALLAGAEELRSTNAGRGLLLKATVTGRGPLHADLRRDGGLNGLLAELREEHHDIARLLWWDGLTDETRPEIDLAAIRSRGDFASELLDVADEIASQPARRKALWATRFKALDAAHIPRDYLDEEDDETLFDRAVRTALDYLDEASDES